MSIDEKLKGIIGHTGQYYADKKILSFVDKRFDVWSSVTGKVTDVSDGYIQFEEGEDKHYHLLPMQMTILVLPEG